MNNSDRKNLAGPPGISGMSPPIAAFALYRNQKEREAQVRA